MQIESGHFTFSLLQLILSFVWHLQFLTRHVSKGGWPFSTSAHGWPISDCTGEGLKGVLALMDSPVVMSAVKKGIVKSIEPSRLYDAVNVILTLQNEDGGMSGSIIHEQSIFVSPAVSTTCYPDSHC